MGRKRNNGLRDDCASFLIMQHYAALVPHLEVASS